VKRARAGIKAVVDRTRNVTLNVYHVCECNIVNLYQFFWDFSVYYGRILLVFSIIFSHFIVVAVSIFTNGG